MPNYVTRMSKDSGEAYQVKDTGAREQISDEVTARESAIAAEAEARQEADQAEAEARQEADQAEATAREAAIEFINENKNISAGANCFDIESWLRSVGTEFTKEGGAYTFRVNAKETTKYFFSEDDADVVFSCKLTILNGTNQIFEFYNESDEKVGEWTKDSFAPLRVKAKAVRMNYGTQGDVTVEELTLIKNNDLSNNELTKSVSRISRRMITEARGIDMADFQKYLDSVGVEYTKSGEKYIVNVNGFVSNTHWFSGEEIPVVASGHIEDGTGSGMIIFLVDRNNQPVNTLTKQTRQIKAIAAGYRIYYGSAGTGIFAGFRIEADQSMSDSMREKIRNETKNAFMVEAPEGFSWKNSPVAGKIYSDGKGSFFMKDFDVSDFKNEIEGGKNYYINPSAGHDTAYDGLSPEHPFKTAKAAYDKTDVGTIYLMPGVYSRAEGFNFFTITKDINIIGLGGDVIITNDWAVGWTEEGNQNIVKRSTSVVPERIVDVLRKDQTGNYINLTQVETLAEVYATPDSWANVSGTLYAHVSGNNHQGYTNIVCSRRDDGNMTISGECNVYLENLKLIGGKTPISAVAIDTTHAPSVFGKECEFWYGQGDANYRNAVTMRGTRLTIFQRCKAMYNGGTDGFNYHTYQDVVPKAIEIDCQGIGNGDDPDGSDQGSTIHEGGKIIRINGVYYGNHGANIGDADEETESWNIGCVCFGSKAQANSQNGNYMAYTGVAMWLDSCVGYSSMGNLAGDMELVKIRNPIFYGELKSPQTEGDPTIY